MLTHGSFCTGYGGLDMAVEHFYDAETVWHSEIETDCSQLLEKHGYENNLGDLTKINWDDVEPVDIMSAGFPCQPFSHAGDRKGNDDERAIFQWIADGISALRPGVVVLENVSGILTLGGTSVIGALAEIGYDARWGLVRASDVGACHRRERWFCISYADSVGAEGNTRKMARKIPPKRQQRGKPDKGGNPSIDSSSNVTDTHSEYMQELENLLSTKRFQKQSSGRFTSGGNTETKWGKYEKAVRRWETTLGRNAPIPLDDEGINASFIEWMMGLPENWVCNQGLTRPAELKMLGNGVVPQQALLALALLNE